MSPSIPGDGDRWAELAQDVSERISQVVREVVPPDAASHLLKAQRELLTALVLIYEHQAGGRRQGRATGRGSRPPRARRRVNRIQVD